MSGEGAFAAFAIELFESLGDIRARKMFGGAGVYCGGVMFGLIADDVIYLKADDALAAALAAEGSGPFIWAPTSGPNAGKEVRMSYWRLPQAALDDADLAADWGRRALAVATASKTAAKPKPKKRRVTRP
jgi:DNA transformation protein